MKGEVYRGEEVWGLWFVEKGERLDWSSGTGKGRKLSGDVESYHGCRCTLDNSGICLELVL